MNEIIQEEVRRRLVRKALQLAELEWDTAMEMPAPGGFLKNRASDKDHIPPDKEAWLEQRVAEILDRQ